MSAGKENNQNGESTLGGAPGGTLGVSWDALRALLGALGALLVSQNVL